MDRCVRDAILWEGAVEALVRCGLCAQNCKIARGGRGLCGVRENVEGTLKTIVYGRVIASSVDPVEKKPLFHFLPASKTYSIATAGCNLRCDHCQNYSISQLGKNNLPPGEYLSPEDAVRNAIASGAKSISYTYTEPTVFLEYALDVMTLAQGAGLKNVFVTNGFMSERALELAAPRLDAANVDLKGFSDNFYREVCGGRLAPVLANIRQLHERGVWLEVTTLVIPGYNDSDSELSDIADFIASVSREIPWHISAFFPTYKLLDVNPTPFETLERAMGLGHDAGLKYVYAGNRPGQGGESTKCPQCGDVVIGRKGFFVFSNKISNNSTCANCDAEIAGIF
ncbi:MAG: AmmeMemoRadiSam system radical SAM enzyme [Deltaproteobacteria bacterium]|nr:MAG: AmmeMemoRadiSam system radical SAM enzyme [Deltaproteobacteria bacterium]